MVARTLGPASLAATAMKILSRPRLGKLCIMACVHVWISALDRPGDSNRLLTIDGTIDDTEKKPPEFSLVVRKWASSGSSARLFRDTGDLSTADFRACLQRTTSSCRIDFSVDRKFFGYAVPSACDCGCHALSTGFNSAFSKEEAR